MHASERYDCAPCGACCREAFDAVEVDRDDPFVVAHPELVHEGPFGRLGVNRAGDRCVCLLVQDGRFLCRLELLACLFTRECLRLLLPFPQRWHTASIIAL